VTAEPYDVLTLPPICITPFITTDLEKRVAFAWIGLCHQTESM